MQMRRNARRKCEIFHEKNNFSIAIRFPSAFGICLASFVGFVQGSCVEVLCLELCSAKSEFELVGIYHGIYMDGKSGASELSRREANSEARSSASRSSLSLLVARRQNSFFFAFCSYILHKHPPPVTKVSVVPPRTMGRTTNIGHSEQYNRRRTVVV